MENYEPLQSSCVLSVELVLTAWLHTCAFLQFYFQSFEDSPQKSGAFVQFWGFSRKPGLLKQGLLLLLLPCVLLRLQLLNMVQLLSFYEVLQANPSHQKLGLEIGAIMMKSSPSAQVGK